MIEIQAVFPYDKLPHLPKASVVGHKGELIYGKLMNKQVICFSGRFHSYEHNMDLALCSLNVRIMHYLGAKVLIATSAAGGINPNFNVLDLMLLKDHIFTPGLAGLGPLVGLNDPRFGPRFVSVHDAYNLEFRQLALGIAKQLGIRLHEGVYVMSGGPQFETPAEVKLYETIGADALGMSICHEVTVARQLSMNVMAFCLITNVAKSTVENAVEISHEEVLQAGKDASARASKFLAKFVETLMD
ncbi:Purine nucleoside phosphorylase [Aphelenchoides bicaudatus]|nr:Purine nucleoside phosphorylase [Aphelenchoides bicaudatus]